uniref:Aminoacyl-tRNA synthetase class Ia domain-containing protein n=1 Tax=Lactuca sativa TaxID=4236 RepID=A0A9R1WFB3_LACSA|nr:hypothetical protein LSAT_V11C200084260 [Lactuca sativa]
MSKNSLASCRSSTAGANSALNLKLVNCADSMYAIHRLTTRKLPFNDTQTMTRANKGRAFVRALKNNSLDQDARNGLTPIKLRAKSAKFAKATVKAQMASFKRFGVWADWDHPYLTLDPEYEAAQIKVFGQMVFKRYIYRRRNPVHWSPSSRTALAEAELEYPEVHVSKSMYAIFKLLTTPTKDGLLDEFPKLSLAIWTTTPWTIPTNAAVAVNSKLQYAIVEVQSPSPDVTSSSEDGKKRIGSVLKGLDVLGDGNAAYPYDWRTKKPTIFRATAQWFASVEGFREAAMDAISQVVWTPSQSLFQGFISVLVARTLNTKTKKC